MPNCIAPKVTDIKTMDDLKIQITWEGKVKVVDIADSDLPSRFPRLNDAGYFKSAKLDGGSISWPDGLHLDLDELVHDWPDVSTQFSNKIAGHYEVFE
jgi:hypothetical protein